jgi:Tol biopolymer transport system component
MRDRRRIAAAAVLVLVAIGQGLPAQARNLVPADYLDMEQALEPQLSPDGTQVVYTRRWVDTMSDKWTSSLWIMNADGSRHRFLVDGSGARWSPDGDRIAYLADGEPEGTQIFVRWMEGDGATSQITHVTEAPANVLWSPDGRSLAFTALVPVKDSWKIEIPEKPEGAEWTKAPPGRAHALPAGSPRVLRARIQSFVHRAGGRRLAARAHRG